MSKKLLSNNILNIFFLALFFGACSLELEAASISSERQDTLVYRLKNGTVIKTGQRLRRLKSASGTTGSIQELEEAYCQYDAAVSMNEPLGKTGGAFTSNVPEALEGNTFYPSRVPSEKAGSRIYIRYKYQNPEDEWDFVDISQSTRVLPTPNLDAGPDKEAGMCTTLTLEASNDEKTIEASSYSYAWTPSNYLDDPTKLQPVFHGEQTKTYTLTGNLVYETKDFRKVCTNKDNVTVTVFPIQANAGVDETIGTCQTAILNASTSEGKDLSFAWTPTENIDQSTIPAPTFTPGTTTEFTVLITDKFGCTSEDQVTIQVDEISANAGEDLHATSCGPVTLNGSKSSGTNISYQWTPASFLDDATSSTPVFTPGTSTDYTLTIIDQYGCNATDDVNVQVHEVVANAGTDQTIGACQQAQLDGTGSYGDNISFLWSPADHLSDPTIPNPIFKEGPTTIFTLTVTDEYGCSTEDQITITVAAPVVANAGADQTTGVCKPLALDGSASSGEEITYQWMPALYLDDNTTVTPAFTPGETTTYTLTITDKYNCQATDQAVINVHPVVANAGPDHLIGICQTATLDGSSSAGDGLTYKWTPLSGLDDPAGHQPVFTPGTTTEFTLQVSDMYGCEATDQVNVEVKDLQAHAGDNKSILGCEQVTLDASSSLGKNITYNWSPARSLDDPASATPLFSAGETEEYTLTVRDDFGCTATDLVTVNVNQAMANAGPDQVIDEGTSTTLNGSASGGSGSYLFSWVPTNKITTPDQPSTPTINLTKTTLFRLDVTDNHKSCRGTNDHMVVFIKGLDIPLSVEIQAIPNAFCVGSHVSFTALPTGGSGKYSYQWKSNTRSTIDHSTDQVIELDLVENEILTVTVTDTEKGDNASKSLEIILSEPPQKFNLSGEGKFCANSEGTSLQLDGSEVGIDYYIAINGVNQHPPKAGTGTALTWENQNFEGTYQVWAENHNSGCGLMMNGDIPLSAIPLPKDINFTTEKDHYCANGDGVTLTLNNTEDDYTYELFKDDVKVQTITGDGNNISIKNQTAGVYTVQGTSSETSCTRLLSDITTVTIDELPVIPEDQKVVLYDTDPNPKVSASVTGGSETYNYWWDPVDYFTDNTIEAPLLKTLDPAGTNPFSVNITATDVTTGCISETRPVQVEIVSPLKPISITTGSPTVCYNADFELTVDPQGGNQEALSFLWTSSTDPDFKSERQNPIISLTEDATFTVVVSDGISTLTDQISIHVRPQSVTTYKELEACETQRIELLAKAEEGDTFFWQKGKDEYYPGETNNPFVTGAAESAIIYGIAIDPYGCPDTTEYTLSVHPIPHAVPQIYLFKEENESNRIILSNPYPDKDYTYDIITNARDYQTQVLKKETGETSIRMTNPKPALKDSFEYRVCSNLCPGIEFCDEAYTTILNTNYKYCFLPTAFSPNGDGINDYFVITPGMSDEAAFFVLKNLKVFNRWGNLVYQSSPYKNKWDGTSNVNMTLGKNLPSGTYFVILELDIGIDIITIDSFVELRR